MSTVYASYGRIVRRGQEVRLTFIDDLGDGRDVVADVVMTTENAKMLAANLAGYFPPEAKPGDDK